MSGEHDPEKLAEGTLTSHLLELRSRLIHIFIAFFVVFVPCAFFANDLFTILAHPLTEVLPEGSSLIATSVTSPFTTPFKLAFYVSLFLVMPYFLFEIWGFVAPGLYRHEKRLAVPIVFSSILLFYAGVAFGYFAVFPGLFKFLVLIAPPEGVKVMTDINDYVSFALTMFLSFGISFEVPIVVILLALTGVMSPAKMGESRSYAIVLIAIVAALLTPTSDALSLTAMGLPMYVLYEGGIVAARILVRIRDEATKHQAGHNGV
jgi:sec-independent protein translocase protein TatC